MPPKKNQAKKEAKSQANKPEGSDYIVFGKETTSHKNHSHHEQPPPTPRPDTRRTIGGQSWTGKLPMNLLSELCQREKWNKPEYSMRQIPNGPSEHLYRSHVTLSKTDPKTRETMTVPPFELPASHKELANQATTLEARHFAATYALFRLASMKNIHMTLPPTYRDLWKGPFQELKKEDVHENRGWKYEADPFAADAKRKEIHVAMEKRKVEQEKKQAEKDSPSGAFPAMKSGDAKKWIRAPKVDLGDNLRSELEAVIRAHTVWNLHQSQLSEAESKHLTTELSASGFRASHVREAVEYCGSKQDVLDWLLIHVPEDDLPPWALMTGYKAGLTLASGDVTKDAKLGRLSTAGYSADLCSQALRDNNGDELAALESLQAALVPHEHADEAATSNMQDDIWELEMEALSAVFSDRFTRAGPKSCSIASDSANCPVVCRFQKPSSGYPTSAVPIIAIDGQRRLPAYIRLSATKQAITYAWDSLLGDQMIFALVDWIEFSMPKIIEDPGQLTDLEVSSTTFSLNAIILQEQAERPSKSKPRHSDGPARRDRRTANEIKQTWDMGQASAAQQKMNVTRSSLPAWRQRSSIVDCVSSQQVTIITGDTGSGKSTQSVQYVLDDAIENSRGSRVNIFCTQPRRVAALALSDRVADERCTVEGDEVGYIIRGDSKTSFRTKITFMTTGVLLRRLQLSSDPKTALEGVSHIFVDEVHERSLDTDFLLALLKNVLPRMPSLKVVCMSATLDAAVFTNYFGGSHKVARAHIEGRTFPVTDFYLDDVLKMTGALNIASGDDEAVGRVIQNLGMGIDYDLIASLVQEIDHQLTGSNGGILIFLPGTFEIDKCLRALSHIPCLYTLPLHASLMPTEQKRVFPPSPKGTRKVIAATNVAETSITIEDIVAVIDTGRVKETSYDSISKIVRLQEVWASQASCRQRRGRAGRIREGTCYKLFTRNVESSMRPQSEPEMQRTPLEQLCLSVKASSPQSDVATFLAQVLSPPEASAVTGALQMLARMGALENDHLTGLGSSMAMIPSDLRCAKLIIYGTLFGCLEPCLTIAAILSVKSPFVSPRDKRDEAKEARAAFTTDNGDLLLDLAAFDEWKANTNKLAFRDVRMWCEQNFLSHQTLRDIDSTRQQLLDALKEADFVPTSYHSSSSNSKSVGSNSHTNLNAHNSSTALLRALVAAALSPQIAEISFPSKKYIASMSGAKELDPEAKMIKYFAEPISSPPSELSGGGPADSGRVFVHPSSVLFSAQSFTGSAAYISYFTKMATSKTFIRDLTPLNAYALLLFGGKIEVDVQGGGMLVDEWLRLRGWARIGVLVSRLRGLVDEVLRRRIDGQGEDGGDGKRSLDGKEGERILALVRKLVEMNGQDR